VPNTKLNYFLYLMPLFITTVSLIAPIQIQGQPTTSGDVCFPVEDNGPLMCTEGPKGGQDVNSTLSEDKSTPRTSEDVCFPVEDNGPLMCTEGPKGGQDVNSTLSED
jgi:hypothetical protein